MLTPDEITLRFAKITMELEAANEIASQGQNMSLSPEEYACLAADLAIRLDVIKQQADNLNNELSPIG